MLMNLNGQERTLNAFQGLFNSVKPRLEVVGVHRPPQGELSLIEVQLASDASQGGDKTNGVMVNGKA